MIIDLHTRACVKRPKLSSHYLCEESNETCNTGNSGDVDKVLVSSTSRRSSGSAGTVVGILISKNFFNWCIESGRRAYGVVEAAAFAFRPSVVELAGVEVDPPVVAEDRGVREALLELLELLELLDWLVRPDVAGAELPPAGDEPPPPPPFRQDLSLPD